MLGIIGVGAIGGSIGMRARRNRLVVTGYDLDPAALDDARRAGAIDMVSTHDDLLRRCDTIVIAAHLQATLGEIAALYKLHDVAASLIIDVASVKVPVVAAATRLRNFVATHPMAGSERSGMRGARADLFQGRPWAYVPTGDAALDARASQFIMLLGGLPLAMSAGAHDRIVAITSHVPQIVAYRFARLLGESDRDAERLCGPVGRELLRIAKMNPEMWREIFAANSANIERELRRLSAELTGAADELASIGVRD
jgi:prephenate dehydrogenase